MLFAKNKHARFLAGALDLYLVPAPRKNVGRIAPPFHEHDRMAVERLFKAELGGFTRIVDAKEIDVVDRRLAVVVVPKGEGRAEGLIGPVKGPHDCSHQRSLPGAQRPGEGYHVTRLQASRKCLRKCVGSLFGGKSYAQCGGPGQSRRALFMSAGKY
jgi:hypothetical protein